jgi:hypothetical protein
MGRVASFKEMCEFDPLWVETPAPAKMYRSMRYIGIGKTDRWDTWNRKANTSAWFNFSRKIG